MASDYGDDAGEKMIDDFMRFGERMGERAMYRRAERLKLAFENATDKARGAAAADGGRAEPAEWAKLDMAEFQKIEGYEGIKDIIEAKLRARSVDSAWFAEPGTGREHLLFRIADAKEVWRSLRRAVARDRRGMRPRGGGAREAGRPRRRQAARRPPPRRPRRAGEVGVGGDRGSARHHPRPGAGAPPAEGEGEMSPARAAVAAALSIAAFLAANSYAACLLSLPGSPAANLAEALRLLPSFLAGHGPSRSRLPRSRRGSWPRAGCGARGRGRSRTGSRSARARSTAAPAGEARARAGAS